MKPLHQLAALKGLELGYHDVFGQWQSASDEALVKVLGTMGLDATTPQAIEQAVAQHNRQHWQELLPPIIVLREDQAVFSLQLNVPQSHVETPYHWVLEEEQGFQHEGTLTPAFLDYLATTTLNEANPKQSVPKQTVKYVKYSFSLPCRPPQGYHQLTLRSENGQVAQCLLVIAPVQCYLPDGLKGEKGLWGLSSQLYSLRSKRNWGLGDYQDLTHLIDWAAGEGAGLVGINPIHEMFPHNPAHISPYSPSSREFFNSAYLAIEAIPELAECAEAQQLIDAPETQKALETLRSSAMVDYSWAIHLKRQVLDLLYRHFVQAHLAAETERAQRFEAFVEAGGEALQRLATYQALQEHFYKEDESLWGWPVWPEAYRSPGNQAVAQFADSNSERVQFFQYLQWLIDEQLQQVGERALANHLPVGLYLDLAVGVDKAGADTWCEQGVFAFNANLGCPPDAFNQLGQNWGLPPQIPEQLKQQQYEPFIRMLRANMKHAGALRIDHAVALYRAFWIPQGETGKNGVYMRYPHEDLLGLIALESHRNQCMVIGEDLGTVPQFVSEGLSERGIYSYKVFFFEKTSPTDFKPPSDYAESALVTVSTHDLPTLSGFWAGQDIEVRSELELFPTTEARLNDIQARAGDRAGILKALELEGLLPDGLSADPQQVPEMTPELSQAIHRYLARSSSKLQIVQLEDGLGLVDQMNLPGTTDEHPNWQRRLPVALEDFASHERLKGLTQALRQEGKRQSTQPPLLAAGAGGAGKKKSV